jgi:hypothetical protein
MHAYGWWEGQSPNLFSMWEATKLPPGMTEGLHNFDRILVPSEQNRELFSEYHPNVHKVVLGVGPEWAPTERKVDDAFRFFTSGGGARKNPEAVARAFTTVFPNPAQMSPRPTLVVKSYGGIGSLYGNPHIEQVTGRLTDEDELALYHHCHVYVSASRGEGFGLQPLQAMASGMPTIVADAHGQAEFAQFATHPIKAELVPAAYFMLGDAGEWWEPDFEELCEAMHDCYHNYGIESGTAMDVAPNVAQAYSWANTATQFIDAFDGALDLPDVGPGTGWTKIESKLYAVKVIREHQAELSDGLHIWVPDQDYAESADVKRLLFEAGILHPDCLSGVDLGLEGVADDKLESMRSRNGYCPTCHQPLNSRPTLADDIYAGRVTV